MTLKTYKAYTPSTRHKVSIFNSELSKKNPERTLIKKYHSANGRNNSGKITTRHKSGGHKKLYRLIDFKRKNYGIVGQVFSIEYDPNRTANIALIKFSNGTKKYILHPENLNVGDQIICNIDTAIKVGNTLTLRNIPLGTEIHNLELIPGKGAQIVRSAGTFARVIAKENRYAIIRLPSKELRLFLLDCFATIGKVGNADYQNIKLGKAGKSRLLGIRPTVRGSAMNPIDHPHGGGEGRSPIGKPNPRTPWGKIALGKKTRNTKKKSNIFILRNQK